MLPRVLLPLAWLLAASVFTGAAVQAGTQGQVDTKPAVQQVTIPAGPYQPLFRTSQSDPTLGAEAGAAPQSERVPAFRLDVYPVTNADFLAFLRVHERWRRSRVPPLFADPGYLRAWQGDLEPGARAPADRPVVGVSWFAARAYCKWRGGALPTTAQWERAAAASETKADGRREPGFRQRILEWYGRPSTDVPEPVGSVYRNVWGVHDLHGLVWEWTQDFNTSLVTGESRGDTGIERRLFCAAGSVGTADPSDYAAFMRHAFRSSLKGDYTAASLGFRCAQAMPHTDGIP